MAQAVSRSLSSLNSDELVRIVKIALNEAWEREEVKYSGDEKKILNRLPGRKEEWQLEKLDEWITKF